MPPGTELEHFIWKGAGEEGRAEDFGRGANENSCLWPLKIKRSKITNISY